MRIAWLFSRPGPLEGSSTARGRGAAGWLRTGARHARSKITVEARSKTQPAGAAGRRGGQCLRAGCGWAGIAAAAGYSSFVIGPLAGSRLNAANSYVSELEVAGQPASGLFRVVDAASGLLLVLLALGLLRWWRPDLLGVLGCLCLAGAGLASFADGADPMSCAPSISASCHHRLDQIPITAQLHQGHTLSSVAGVLCVILSMLLLGGSWRAGAWPQWVVVSRMMGLAVAILAIVEVPLTFTGRGVGAIERIHVVVVSAWIASVGWQLYRCARTADRQAGSRSGCVE